MPNNLTSYILDNGLTVYFYNDNTKHTVHAELITKYGGKNKDFIFEGKEYHTSDGIAHLIEHFICEHGQAGNFISLTGENLIYSNALTYLNKTCYFVDGIENVKEALKIMLTNIYNPIFTDENLTKVKHAIYEEIRRCNDRKFFEFNIEFEKCLYQKNHFKSTIGTIKEIENVDLETLQTCYKAFYQPTNQFLIVAGNFDKEQYLKVIKEFFATQKIEKHETKMLDLNEPVTVKKNYFKVYKETEDTYTAIRYKIDVRNLSPKEKLDLENSLIDYLTICFGYGSPLRKKLEDNKTIIGPINCYVNFETNFAICGVAAYTTDTDVFVKEIQKEINAKKFDEELFNLEVKETLTRFIIRFDYLSQIVSPFVDNIVTFNYPYLDEAKDFDISFEKYKNIINGLDFSNYTIGELIDPKYKETSK